MRSTKKKASGSAGSSQLDFFLPETWTPGPSRTSVPMTSAATPNAISSPASGSGPSLSGKPGGPTNVPSGPAPAHASLSPRQAKAAGLLTSGTSGRPGIGSSNSAALQSSLESRLRVALSPTNGSTLYKMTWKPWITPSGRSRFQLLAWPRRSSGIVYTGWPTPKVGNSKGRGRVERSKQGRIEDTIHVILWPGGITRAGSIAATEERAPLNPDFCRWLQGVPAIWSNYGPTATASASLPPGPLLRRFLKE
jgi:hypothetical protein